MDYEQRYNVCKAKTGDINKANCLYGLLRDITRLQDEVQLSIPAINESVAISNNLINNANALILEASKYKGDIRPQVLYGYTRGKVGAIVENWNAMAHDYNITQKDQSELLVLEHKKEFKIPIIIERPERAKEQEEDIFKDQDKLR